MTSFFEIFGSNFHALFICSIVTSVGFGKWTKHFVALDDSRPFEFDKLKASYWVKFLILEDSVVFGSHLALIIFSFINYHWWFGLILLFEYLVLGGVILGVLEGNPFFSTRQYNGKRWIHFKSIGLIIDSLLWIYLFKTIGPSEPMNMIDGKLKFGTFILLWVVFSLVIRLILAQIRIKKSR